MSSHRLRRVGATAAAVSLVTATAYTASAAGLSDPIPQPIPEARVDIALKPVAQGLVAPVAATHAPRDRRHLFVADQNGKLWGITVHGRGGRHGEDGHRVATVTTTGVGWSPTCPVCW